MVVNRQSVSTVPDIELGIGIKKLVIYGKVFYTDQVTAFSNKLNKICNQLNNPVASTTTSEAGEYGIDISYSLDDFDNLSYNLGYDYDNTRYGFNYMSFINQYPNGIIHVDAYGSWIFGPEP